MLNALSACSSAATQPQKTFLLVQEIVDETNYNRLTNNVQGLHSICVGGTDKGRLIFSHETAASLSKKIFAGLDQRSKAMLLLLCDSGFSPSSVLTPADQQRN